MKNPDNNLDIHLQRDFEQRLASLNPASPRLTWTELQAQLEHAATEVSPDVVSVAKPSHRALALSWLGGMAVGASLAFLMLGVWKALTTAETPSAQAALPISLDHPRGGEQSSGTNLLEDNRSLLASNHDVPAQEPRAARVELKEADYRDTASKPSRQLWIETLSSQSSMPLDAEIPLTAGKHFVTVPSLGIAAMGIDSSSHVDLSHETSPSDVTPFYSGIESRSPITSRELLRNILENDKDLLL